MISGIQQMRIDQSLTCGQGARLKKVIFFWKYLSYLSLDAGRYRTPITTASEQTVHKQHIL